MLSSGGVDSTTCLALAVRDYGAPHVTSVSIYYGQRHSRELEAARALARHYGVEHRELDLASILSSSKSSLMANSSQMPSHGSYAGQIARRQQAARQAPLDGAATDGATTGQTATGQPPQDEATPAEDVSGLMEPLDTYVPFRNGLMLSAVAALAMSLNPTSETSIYLGAHADDAAGNAYPDCSDAFMQAMGSAINIGTYGRVTLEAPFVNASKAQVVACGLELGVPYGLTWSCYEGADKPCGQCATCLDRIAAFRANGVEDPVVYADSSDAADPAAVNLAAASGPAAVNLAAAAGPAAASPAATTPPGSTAPGTH